MGLFRRNRKPAPTTDEQVAQQAASADYDTQKDLALSAVPDADVADDGFVPFTGTIAPEAPQAAYDADRDTGL